MISEAVGVSHTSVDEWWNSLSIIEMKALAKKYYPHSEWTFVAESSFRHDIYAAEQREARQFAALPDIVAALKMYMAQYAGNGQDERELRPELIAARAALAKAGLE